MIWASRLVVNCAHDDSPIALVAHCCTMHGAPRTASLPTWKQALILKRGTDSGPSKASLLGLLAKIKCTPIYNLYLVRYSAWSL